MNSSNVTVIGGADGPTAIYLASKISDASKLWGIVILLAVVAWVIYHYAKQKK